MTELFPSIHLYTLFGAALALMSVAMSRKLYHTKQGSTGMIPFYLVAATGFHIIWVAVAKVLECPEDSWHLVLHIGLLLAFLWIGHQVYTDHLVKNAEESIRALLEDN